MKQDINLMKSEPSTRLLKVSCSGKSDRSFRPSHKGTRMSKQQIAEELANKIYGEQSQFAKDLVLQIVHPMMELADVAMNQREEKANAVADKIMAAVQEVSPKIGQE